MQGAGTIGGGLAAYGQEQALDEPLHPALQKYLQRLMAGEDPNQLAEQARLDPAVQEMINEARAQLSQSRPRPADAVPDAAYQRGQPSVLAPGTISPSGGPQGPAGSQAGLAGLAARGNAGGAWNANRPLLSQPSPQSQGLGAATEALQPQVEQQTPPIPAQGAAQPAPQPQPDQQPLPYSQPPQRPMGAAVVNAQGASGYRAPEPGAFGGMSPATSPRPRPQPAPAAQPRPAAQAPGPATPVQSGGAPQRPLTQRDLRSMGNALPAMIAGAGRGDVARVNAQSKVQVAKMQTDVKGMLGALKERGLNTQRFDTLVLAIEKLDDAQQQAVLKELGANLRAELQASSRERVAEGRRPQKDADTLAKEIVSLNSAISQLRARKVTGLNKGDEQQIRDWQIRIKHAQTELDNLRGTPQTDAPRYVKPTVTQKAQKNYLSADVPEVTEPRRSPRKGEPFDNINYNRETGETEYRLGNTVVETTPGYVPPAEPQN